MRSSSTVPVDEWVDAGRLLTIPDPDERSRFGFVHVRSDGNRREWSAGNPFYGAVMVGGADPHEYEALIPPSVFHFVIAAAAGTESVELVVEDDGVRRIGVVGPGGSLFIDEATDGLTDIGTIINADFDVMGSVRLTAERLFGFAEAPRRRVTSMSSDIDPDDAPTFWIEITDDGLTSIVSARDAGVSRSTIAVDESTGSGAVRLNPAQLQLVTELFRPDEQVDVHIPHLNSEPVRIFGATTRAALMPFRTEAINLRLKIEEIIDQTCGHLAVARDQDGDYPLLRRRTPVFARLSHDMSPPTLQVFAVLLQDVESTPELLSEINDLNASLGFARVFLVDRQVLAEVDLVAATLDPAELRTAIDRILEVAHRMVVMLSTFFGGDAVDDPSEVRWQLYRSTVIEAEPLPGELLPLTGPNAVDAWPFQGPVHVLTGWNPQGVERTDELNEEINVQIAADVVAMGARFVHGFGRSPGGDHSEPSLIVWGLTRADALDIGRRAAQDAIFEIDPDEVHLMSCFDGRIETWPRRG